MRKLFAIAVVAALLSSMFVFSASAEQSNMEVNALKFTKSPTIDGVISEEEWGAPTVHVRTDYAATEDDDAIGYDPELDVRNIFYWFDVEGYCDALSYDLWLRWDDNAFYMALAVEDPDPFSNPFEGVYIWRGDMVQFTIDTAGPNSAMFAINPDYDYHTDDYNQARLNYPWADGNKVFKGTLGLANGVEAQSWFNTPSDENRLPGEDTSALGITYVTHEPTSDSEFETNTIYYELMVPWSMMVDEIFVPSAGAIVGMVVVVGCSDADTLNAWLSWGHGVCHTSYPESQPRATRGGSQAVILSDEGVTPGDSYPFATTEEAAPPATDNAADPAQTGNAAVSTGDAADTDNADAAATDEAKAPAATGDTGSAGNESDGLPTGAVIGIVAAAIVVIAVIAAVVSKKKK